jgi:hypothetical protein
MTVHRAARKISKKFPKPPDALVALTPFHETQGFRGGDICVDASGRRVVNSTGEFKNFC